MRIITIIIFTFQSIQAQEKKVLFIGNSYTFFNDMPEMVDAAASSTGDNLLVSESTVGGTNFQFHATSALTENNINANDWDFVSVQGNSVEVAVIGDYFDDNVVPYAMQLVDKIKANNACSQPIFYRTWGRENGLGGTTCANYPTVCTYETMDNTLASNYGLLANDNDGLVSPVGAVWRYLRSNSNPPDLYDDDESHPSLAGSYAAACTFYSIILRKDPTLITYDAGLDPAVASQIRTAAKLVVYNDLSTWNVGEFDPIANFDYTIDDAEVTFNNNAINADGFSWDFGDGNVSTNSDPVHTYSQTGVFNVTLVVTQCGVSDSYQTTVNISSLSIEDAIWENLKFYPNPIQHYVFIEGISLDSIKALELIDLQGKIIPINLSVSKSSIDFSDIPAGSYFLKIQLDTGAITTRKLIKK